MPTVTKTLHPLPFEHLEPKRFEDLVRQLAYDFRQWRALEATGRSGSDDGYDIRGSEIVSVTQTVTQNDDEDADTVQAEPSLDRLWLIQCKREQKIGPAKLKEYLDAITAEEKARLYGIIFAASCNISKAARDYFIQTCREVGISECYVWSRAEIEDMLFQPKNDGLLFAYFGISFTIRRRSLVTKLRSRLATKRKCSRVFGSGEYIYKRALFIDPQEEHYPYTLPDQKFADLPWKIHQLESHHPRALIVNIVRHIAFLDDDGVHWDAADTFNDENDIWSNPWADDADREAHMATREELLDIQRSWPKLNGATLIATGLIEYDDIVEIDGDGDSYFRQPIIYVSMIDNHIPLSGTFARLVTHPIFDESSADGTPKRIAEPREIKLRGNTVDRIVKFPQKFRRF